MSEPTCASCGSPVTKGARFCSNCGHPVGGDAEQSVHEGPVCPGCGSPIKKEWYKCAHCKRPLRTKPTAWGCLIVILIGVMWFISSLSDRGNRQSRPSAPRPAGINCEELRYVAKGAMEAVTVNPAIERDTCWDDGGRAVYEAFVRTAGQSGRLGHFKYTFRGLDVRSGLAEVCQDVRTGEWECLTP